MTEFEVHVTANGAVSDGERRYAEEKLRHAATHAPRPVLSGRVALARSANPSVERPAFAKGALDVSGRLVRAHVTAETMREAADLLDARLRHQLDILAGRREAARTEPTTSPPGEWRHGSLPTARPAYFPRPPEERDVVRHETYTLDSATPAEAAADMELLDYEFHLFTNSDSERENVVFRRSDGSLEVLEAAPELTVDEAVDELDLSGHQFVFFLNRETGRGNLVFHRYDGHYGLVTPAATA